MKHTLQLTVDSLDSKEDLSFQVNKLINAGYGARDQSNVRAHIEEMKDLNLKMPETIPTIFPLSNHMVTTETSIQVQHKKTNGEVEFMLLLQEGEWYVAVGSDHTDRELESFSVPICKQAYPNFIAPVVWRVNDIIEHWDQIQLKAWMTVDGKRERYQEGTFGDILPFSFWEKRMKELDAHESGSAIMCGTVPTVDGLKYGEKFEYEMFDPVLDRKVASFYDLSYLMPPIE